MTRWTDRLGYSFHFEYDAEGRCVHTFGDDGLFEVFLEYYPAQKCTIVRHADGGVWTYYYNDVGSLTEIRPGLRHHAVQFRRVRPRHRGG